MARHTSRILVGTGVAASAFAGIVYAIANHLVSFALDTEYKHSTFNEPQRVTRTQPVHLDAQEEEESTDWFEQSKQPVVVTSEDGLQLHGWLFDPDCASPAPHCYAICCHGYTGEPVEMAKYAHRFARLGFTVLVPAMRGHELSEGRYVGMGWLDRRDLMRWIDLIVSSDADARILLQGRSMGAAAVMMTVGEPDLPRNVVAAIEDCGYTSVWDQFLHIARSFYHLPKFVAKPFVAAMSTICQSRAGYGFQEASCEEQLRHTTIPMLFIHGGDDDFVSPQSLDRNFDACASIDRQKLLIPTAGHSMSASTAPIIYWRTVTNFVKRIFAL